MSARSVDRGCMIYEPLKWSIDAVPLTARSYSPRSDQTVSVMLEIKKESLDISTEQMYYDARSRSRRHLHCEI